MTDRSTHLSVVDDDVAEPGLVDLVRRRVGGTYDLDAWGMDPDLTRLAARVAALRWTADVVGLENLPDDVPLMLIANRRLGWSEPAVVASVLTRELGWLVRPVGGMQIDPVGGVLRRLGAIPARPAEVDAALRAGNRVLVPTRREPIRHRAGHLPIEFLAPAVRQGVPLIPVAVVGWELGRRWNIRIGRPVLVGGPVQTADVDARLVGAAAVEVSSALADLLAHEPRGDIGRRLLSIVSRRDGSSEERQWEVS